MGMGRSGGREGGGAPPARGLRALPGCVTLTGVGAPTRVGTWLL